MSRDGYDFIDEIESQVDFERRQERLAAAVVRNKAIAESEARLAAEAKARSDALTERANVSFRLAEYEAAGVPPPFTDGLGNPTVSLSFLKQQGWEVKDLGGQRVLLRPNGDPPRGRLQSEV